MAALPLVALLSITFIFIAYSLYQRLRFNLPPGPRSLPVVGNLYDIKPVRFKCFADWAKVYGPIFSVYFGSQLNVIVTTSDLAKEVLKDNDQYLADRFRTRPTARMSRNGKDLIWADYGPHYVKVRKFCNLELFTPKRLEGLRPIREDEVSAMVESIFKFCINPGAFRFSISSFFPFFPFFIYGKSFNIYRLYIPLLTYHLLYYF